MFGGSGGGSSGVFNLSHLNSANGFKLDGENSLDYSGWSVSAGGDINGDGLDDLLIGAPNNNAGQSYVVFGSTKPWPASLSLSVLNGTSGFTLNGINANDQSGYSVSTAGDING